MTQTTSVDVSLARRRLHGLAELQREQRNRALSGALDVRSRRYLGTALQMTPVITTNEEDIKLNFQDQVEMLFFFPPSVLCSTLIISPLVLIIICLVTIYLLPQVKSELLGVLVLLRARSMLNETPQIFIEDPHTIYQAQGWCTDHNLSLSEWWVCGVE